MFIKIVLLRVMPIFIPVNIFTYRAIKFDMRGTKLFQHVLTSRDHRAFSVDGGPVVGTMYTMNTDEPRPG